MGTDARRAERLIMPERIKISAELPANIRVNVQDLIEAAPRDPRYYAIIFGLLKKHCERHGLAEEAKLFDIAGSKTCQAMDAFNN